MASKKAIKLRRAGVKTIKQIVKAMNMVAATKMQRAKVRLAGSRPLFQEAERMLNLLAVSEGASGNRFFRKTTGRRAAYIIITSDRGLCGSYNSNVSQAALRHMNEDREEQILAIGQRGREFFHRHGKQILHAYPGMSETAFYEDAQTVAKELLHLYTSGEVDEVYLAYTKFESVLSHVPRVMRILPIGTEEVPTSGPNPVMEFEPDVDTVLEAVVPLYLNAVLYGALQESSCSEQAARMLSMDAATKNATEIIDDLTRMYNRKRQAGITQEITEIVGGANVNKQR